MDCFLFSRDTSRVKSVSIIGLRTDRSTGFSARDAIASKKREGLEKRKLHVSGEQGGAGETVKLYDPGSAPPSAMLCLSGHPQF